MCHTEAAANSTHRSSLFRRARRIKVPERQILRCLGQRTRCCRPFVCTRPCRPRTSQACAASMRTCSGRCLLEETAGGVFYSAGDGTYFAVTRQAGRPSGAREGGYSGHGDRGGRHGSASARRPVRALPDAAHGRWHCRSAGWTRGLVQGPRGQSHRHGGVPSGGARLRSKPDWGGRSWVVLIPGQPPLSRRTDP